MHQTNGPTRTQSTDTIGLSQPHPGIRRFAVRVMAILLVAAAIIASVVADARARVPEGIAIAGVAVGGVSAAEAERLVSARAVELAKRPVVVIGPQGTVHTSGVGLRARPRVAAAVAAAGVHRFGRARDWLDGGPPRQVQLSWAVDGGDVRKLARELVRTVRPSEATVIVDAAGVRVREGRVGYAVDVGALRSRLDSLSPVVRAPTMRIAPQITTAEARATAQRVERLTGIRRTILLGPVATELQPETLRALVRVRRIGSGGM